jgi:lysyl-tRNA synthetase class 2
VASEDDLIAARRKHVEKLGELGVLPYPNGFVGDAEARRELAAIASDPARCALLPSEQELPPDARVYPLYGRLVARRGPFMVIRTPHGDVQALVRPENLAATEAALIDAADLADHLAIEGPLLRTRTGAATVKALRYQHLGKALLPPPDKWHGLTDVEKRYRERYVDLFSNPDVAQVFRARARLVSSLRAFLDGHGYLEVETPLLQPLRGGATARPFRTHHNALDIPLFLRVAPELYLKRLLVGGLDRVYELGRAFRNEGVSTRHNPEFTLLECYQAYATCDNLMDLVEQMIRHADAALSAEFPSLCAERSFELAEPFARVTMRGAIADRLERGAALGLPTIRWANELNREVLHDEARLDAALKAAAAPADARQALDRCISYGERVFVLFERIAEPDLPALFRSADGTRALPTFVTEHPVEVSPLARKNDLDPRFVDRFELFIDHKEVANAFSELNDPDDQDERFHAQLRNRERGDDEAMDYDGDYIRALRHGMPPAAGLGVGIDRLLMMLCKQESIRDVLLFPLLKPELS